MKVTITLEDKEDGNATIVAEFSEPVTEETKSASALYAMAIMKSACKFARVDFYSCVDCSMSSGELSQEDNGRLVSTTVDILKQREGR